jgi:hypothetical protein
MFYKYVEDEDLWWVANEIYFPNGFILNSSNKEIESDGWFWSETPPNEYIIWEENKK